MPDLQWIKKNELGDNCFMNKSRWNTSEIALLLKTARTARSKCHAFSEVARITGRKTDSVRNYYYKFHAVSKKQVVPFHDAEVRALLKQIVLGTSRGESVRSICHAMAKGDRAGLLRLQNKYRCIAKRNPERIAKVAKMLEGQGYLVKIPSIIKSNVITMPLPKTADKKLTDVDINNLFMGLVRLIRKSASDERDNQIQLLKNEIERLKRVVEGEQGNG